MRISTANQVPPSKPENTVRQAIDEIFGVEPIDVRPFDELSHPRIFVCEVDGRRIAAKLPDISAGVRLNVREQFRVMHRAAAHNLTAKPIAVDPRTSVLFVEWIHDADAASFSVRSTVSLVAAADVVRSLHRLPIRVRSYAPVKYAQDYIVNIKQNNRACELLGIIEKAVSQSGERFSGDVCCHNDLHAGNFLNSDSLRLIDFEYAVQADPVVDLASFVAMNALDDAQTDTFLSRYSGGSTNAIDPSVFADAVAVQRALAELWRLARESC